MTILPPFLVTRRASPSALSPSEVFRRPKEMVTTSNSPSAKGRFSVSANVKGKWGRALRPAASMPCEKSAGITSATAAARGSELDQVPAARSRIFMPGAGAIVAVVARRQALVRPKLNKSFTRPYRLATPSNIAATSSGFLSILARDMVQVSRKSRLSHNLRCKLRFL